ncbi:hypothetical protein CULC22_02039 [Corynebacterium ulcerans BR-AD22]|nr:hypothetical protein CULC22_02039 [Corynebacterium ulcerans BR-AD22]
MKLADFKTIFSNFLHGSIGLLTNSVLYAAKSIGGPA